MASHHDPFAAHDRMPQYSSDAYDPHTAPNAPNLYTTATQPPPQGPSRMPSSTSSDGYSTHHQPQQDGWGHSPEPSRQTLVGSGDFDQYDHDKAKGAGMPAGAAPYDAEAAKQPSRFSHFDYAEPPPEPYYQAGGNPRASMSPPGATAAGQKPYKQRWYDGFYGAGKYPVEQAIEAKRRGIGRQRYAIVSYLLAIVMGGVLIYELVLNNREQGSPVSFKPVVNPMLGPSTSALINIGARFVPCMKSIDEISADTPYACMNNTANPPTIQCSLESVCGFGGFKNEKHTPDQSFRFVTPIFLHGGIVHFLLNMLAQCVASAQIERDMGSIGFTVTYFSAGIFGNVLGANFGLLASASTGASGAIMGTLALNWVDLFAHWGLINRPVRRLVVQIIELIFIIGFGYIPFVDNYAHLGGLLMGFLVGTVFYPVISRTKRHQTVVWVFRLAAIPFAVILFVTLTRNFYTGDPYKACRFCRYLSCFPTNANDHCNPMFGLTST